MEILQVSYEKLHVPPAGPIRIQYWLQLQMKTKALDVIDLPPFIQPQLEELTMYVQWAIQCLELSLKRGHAFRGVCRVYKPSVQVSYGRIIMNSATIACFW